MRWTSKELEILESNLLIGESTKNISLKINRSTECILSKMRRLGITKNNSWSEEKIQVLVDGVTTGISLLDIALELNISLKGVRNKAKSIGLIPGKYNEHIGKIDPNEPGICYLVYFPELNLYKVGITGRTVFKRMQNLTQKYEIILQHKFSKGIEAIQLEQKWLFNLKEHKINTGLLRNGNTETFRL